MNRGCLNLIHRLVDRIPRPGSPGVAATVEDLNKAKSEIMSKISEFAAKQKAHNERIETAVGGLTEDVKTLNDKITELQESSGQVTPEDQALLDELQAQGEALATKLEALDNVTPPAIPPGV